MDKFVELTRVGKHFETRKGRFVALREVGPVVPLEETGMLLVGGHDDVREVLANPDIYSSGVDAVSIGQVRPLLPLQIDPPDHKSYRKLLDRTADD